MSLPEVRGKKLVVICSYLSSCDSIFRASLKVNTGLREKEDINENTRHWLHGHHYDFLETSEVKYNLLCLIGTKGKTLGVSMQIKSALEESACRKCIYVSCLVGNIVDKWLRLSLTALHIFASISPFYAVSAPSPFVNSETGSMPY